MLSRIEKKQIEAAINASNATYESEDKQRKELEDDYNASDFFLDTVTDTSNMKKNNDDNKGNVEIIEIDSDTDSDCAGYYSCKNNFVEKTPTTKKRAVEFFDSGKQRLQQKKKKKVTPVIDATVVNETAHSKRASSSAEAIRNNHLQIANGLKAVLVNADDEVPIHPDILGAMKQVGQLIIKHS